MILSCSFLLLIMGFSWFCVSMASLDAPGSCLLSRSINHLHMTAMGFMGIQKLLYISIGRLVVVLPGSRTCRPSNWMIRSWAFLTVHLNYYVKILLLIISNLRSPSYNLPRDPHLLQFISHEIRPSSHGQSILRRLSTPISQPLSSDESTYGSSMMSMRPLTCDGSTTTSCHTAYSISCPPQCCSPRCCSPQCRSSLSANLIL